MSRRIVVLLSVRGLREQRVVYVRRRGAAFNIRPVVVFHQEHEHSVDGVAAGRRAGGTVVGVLVGALVGTVVGVLVGLVGVLAGVLVGVGATAPPGANVSTSCGGGFPRAMKTLTPSVLSAASTKL